MYFQTLLMNFLIILIDFSIHLLDRDVYLHDTYTQRKRKESKKTRFSTRIHRVENIYGRGRGKP